MTFAVLIKPANYTIFVEPDESVLDAALRQGYDFPYSCHSATCGTCMGKVIEGQITYGDDVEPYALDEAAQADGYALFCSARPTSDLIIEVEDVFEPGFQLPSTADYKIDKQTIGEGNIHQILLSPAIGKYLHYRAGQYINIISDGAVPVPFSIANAPVEGNRQIELHIHEVAPTVHTTAILNAIAANKPLTLQGPYGKMRYRPEPKLPIIFVAGGTGVVPFKAIIEAMLANAIQQEVHLYWGVHHEQRLYLDALFTRWEKHVAHFTYKPVVGGHVHEAVLQDFADLSGYQVFASGSPELVYTIKKTFIAQGLKPQFIYSDVFEHFPEK